MHSFNVAKSKNRNTSQTSEISHDPNRPKPTKQTIPLSTDTANIGQLRQIVCSFPEVGSGELCRQRLLGSYCQGTDQINFSLRDLENFAFASRWNDLSDRSSAKWSHSKRSLITSFEIPTISWWKLSRKRGRVSSGHLAKCVSSEHASQVNMRLKWSWIFVSIIHWYSDIN